MIEALIIILLVILVIIQFIHNKELREETLASYDVIRMLATINKKGD